MTEWEHDPSTGYHYNQSNGCYYDPNSGFYYTDALGKLGTTLCPSLESKTKTFEFPLNF